MRRTKSVLAAWLAPLALCFLLTDGIGAAQTPVDFNVNSVADKVDANPGDGSCSTGSLIDGHTPECTLRAAIDEVNALSKINPSHLYKVSVMAGTYSLSTSETCVYTDAGSIPRSTTTSVLCISGNLTLVGADPQTTIVDHALADRDFFVSAGASVVISNMTIQHGGQYGGSYDGGGGGINNQGNLTLSNDTFSENHSDVGGGAVYNGATLTVQGSTFRANTAVAFSSAGIQSSYGTTSIDTSFFFANHGGQGAAIGIFDGKLQISNSTFAANVVDQNGIITTYGSTASITNSTISGNTIGNAGAVVGSGYTLNNDTIYGNTAGNGIAGLLGDTISIANTIVYANTPNDCAISPNATDLGHNLFGKSASDACPSSDPTTRVGVDPKLGPLTLDGGYLQTQTPLPGSPAIHAGSSAAPGSNVAGACAALDERGFVRGATGTCTIGAAEPLGGFHVNNILPSVGAPGGTASVLIQGSGFLQGTTVVLRSAGHPDIPALQTTVALDTYSVSATLDLSQAANGSYDVVATLPSGTQSVLRGGFTVQRATPPKLYSFLNGPTGVRRELPATYTVVYGNESNQDAFLVPLTFSIPGGYAGLITSHILPPPPASGQAIDDWTYVPVEVGPYSTTTLSNVPLIIPVIPAGSGGILQFSVTAPSDTPEFATFTIDAGLGTPYSTVGSSAVDPAVLAQFVTGAQNYAQSNLGVTISSKVLAQMSSYAANQLAQEVQEGRTALLTTASARPAFFSSSQLSIDIATYGASLATGSTAASALKSPMLSALALRPQGEATPAPPQNCGGILPPGTSGGAGCGSGLPTPVPSPGIPKPGDPNFGKVTRDGCTNVPNHHVSADGTECLPNNLTGCPKGGLLNVLFPDHDCQTLPILASVDPNEKDGPLGVGTDHFTLAANPFHYQIEFENSPSASAPAQTVAVSDPLDKSLYDLSTFQLGPISFGRYEITPPPGLASFAGAMDLRPTSNVIVTVQAALDRSTGVASWKFTSLDPGTMQAVTDPTAGFLPPDVTPPAGIGHVAFSVQPLASLSSGTKVCNTGSIVFDTNAAIATAPFCNSKDTAGPVSSVQPLPATQTTPTFTVSWSGSDAGVGVAFYVVYVSVDGGPFTVWQAATASTSASYTGAIGHTYGFYSIATDLLGNVEPSKTVAEATTTLASSSSPKATISGVSFGNVNVGSTASGTVVLTNTGTVPVTFGAATASGPDFTALGRNCVGTVAVGQSCSFYVYFAPTVAGPASGSLSIVTNAGTLVASLTGAGVAPAKPTATISGVSFGNVNVGSSASGTVVLTNTGTVPVTFGAATASGPGFTALGLNCIGTVAVGQSCKFYVYFAPTAAGPASGSLNIVTNAGTLVASLTGTGVAPAKPTATISGVSFGNVNVGSSASGTVVLTNTGTVPVTFGAATASGPGFTALGLNCVGSVAVGQSCKFYVYFAPTVAGPASGSLSIVTNAGTLIASLTGTGIGAGSPALSAVSSLAVRTDGSYAVTVTVTNSGAATASSVVLSSLSLAGVAGTPTPQPLGDIPSSKSASVTVVVPASAGAHGAPVVERFTGTYTGGSFGGSLRTTLP